MSQISDILIVGGGPAGALLAHKLASHGLSVVVLERSPQVKRKVCGEYLCPLGVKLLDDEGLTNEIVGEFLPLHGMLMVTSSGIEVPTSFPCAKEFHGVSVNREQFDSKFLKRAEKSGAQIQQGVAVTKIFRVGDLWAAETTRGRFIGRILIGADGRSSVVSKSLSNDVEVQGRRVALHAFVESAALNNRYGEMHLFSSGAYIGLNPTGASEVNFSLVLDNEELRQLGGAFKAMNHYLERSPNLKARFAPFENEGAILGAYPIQHRTHSIVPAKNVALIGDAAGFIDPLTGEGMYNALLSAQILGDEIISGLGTALLAPPSVFSNYKKKYIRVLRNKMLLNRGFQKIIRYPWVTDLLARFLLTRKHRADAFIGIIGNIYSPLQGLLKLI